MDPNENEIPSELIVPPEKRLVRTLIMERPHALSFLVSASMILLIVLVTQIYWQNINGWGPLLPAIHNNIFKQGELWRVFTAVLVHGDMGHLLSNMYMLGVLSYFVFGYFGFKAFPLFTFFGAGIVNLISIYSYPGEVRLIGASGLVYLLGGFWLGLYFLIQKQHSVSKRLLRVLGMALMVFFPTTFEPTTSYRTHFIGIVLGLLMGVFYYFRTRKQIRAHDHYEWVD